MYIKVSKNDAAIIDNSMESEIVIRLNTIESLDNIIQQCRDIKMSILEGEK